ncbi:MAG TPA: Hsp70 family protein [Symbiobacteriaceae bacterium]|nr:Hsp70 family protein [Symbiobacteriaceae bacterium]
MATGESLSTRQFKYLPLSIRLETLGGIATPLVLKGTPLPTKRSHVYSTAADNQDTVEIRVLMGESPLTKRCTVIGSVELKGIPPAPRGKPRISVIFEVDERCAVRLTGSVDGTPLKVSRDIAPDIDLLTVDSIQHLLRTFAEHAAEDEREVSRIETIQGAERAIQRAEERLSTEDTSGLLGLNRNEIAKKIAAAGQAIEMGDVDRIRKCTTELESALSENPMNDVFGMLFGKPSPAISNPAQRAPGKPSPTAAAAAQQSTKGQGTTSQPAHLGRIFGGGHFTVDPKLCFVLMPFAEAFRPIYQDHIRPVVQKAGFTCLRADEIRGTNIISQDIWENINRARLLIADLTGQNANVFYEVGLAHAVGKDVILLTQSNTDVPFDLKAIRYIVYNYTPPGMKEMETTLLATISAVAKSS